MDPAATDVLILSGDRCRPNAPNAVSTVAAARSEASRRLAEDGAIARMAAAPKPAYVLEFVEAADLRAADYAVRTRRRVGAEP